MAIVCIDYYTNTYMGEPIAPADFQRANAKAERLITQITHGRAANYAALPAFQQAAIRDAICAQIEYLDLEGLDVAINGDTGSHGWTVGKVHINGTGGVSAASGTGSTMVCAAAIAALEQTGLLNPQVETVGMPPPGPYPWGWM